MSKTYNENRKAVINNRKKLMKKLKIAMNQQNYICLRLEPNYF